MNIADFLKSNVFCCCFKKPPKYRYVCAEGDDEERRRVLSAPLLDSYEGNEPLKKATTCVFRYRRYDSLTHVSIRGNDLVQDKEENPALYYEKIAELGEGSFGKVLKVQHITTGAIRAIKVINKSDLDHSEIVREGNVLKSLSHPNIIQIYEVFHYLDSIYLVEELIKGGDLFSKIAKMERLAENVSLMIMKQIFSAVHYLHSNGLIHGDLKLENIMVESLNIKKGATLLLADKNVMIDEFDIKLIDFGCSNMFFKGKPLTELIGTIYYLAPEVILSSYNNKCDIWSCGVILYILLCGKFPFNGDTNGEIFEKIKNCNYHFNHTEFNYISKDTINLIKRCLEPDPYKRITAEEALNSKCFSNFTKKTADIEQLSTTFVSVVANLKAMKNKLIFQKAVTKYITYHLISKEERNKIRNIYKMFDTNNDGFLSFQELCSGLKHMGVPINEGELTHIADILDPEKTGVIEYEDFIDVFIDKSKVLETNNLKYAFDVFDIDKSGAISTDEIKSIFRLNSKFDEKQTEQIIQQLDLKSQHEMTFEKFKDLMLNSYNTTS